MQHGSRETQGTGEDVAADVRRNLAAVYLDERRWLRVLALTLSAGFFASALRDDARERIGSLMHHARSCVEPAVASRMFKAAMEGGQREESFTEILWHLEDLEIQGEVPRTRAASGR